MRKEKGNLKLEQKRLGLWNKLVIAGILFSLITVSVSGTIRLEDPSGATSGYWGDGSVIRSSNGKSYIYDEMGLRNSAWDLNDTGGTIWLPIGEAALTTGPWVINNYYINIIGAATTDTTVGTRGTTISYTSKTNEPIIHILSDNTRFANGGSIKRLGLKGNETTMGIHMQSVGAANTIHKWVIEDVWMEHVSRAIYLQSDNNSQCHNNVFNRVKISHVSEYGILEEYGGAWNIFKDFEITDINETVGYAIHSDSPYGWFETISVDGCIWTYGRYTQFKNIIIEGLNSGPLNIGMRIAGQGTYVDGLTFVTSSPVHGVSLHTNGYMSVKHISTYGSPVPNIMILTDGTTTGILEDINGGNYTFSPNVPYPERLFDDFDLISVDSYNCPKGGVWKSQFGNYTFNPSGGTVLINETLQLQPIASAPGGATEGSIYYDSTYNKLRLYNDTGWFNVTLS